jgi:uncharacterized membrane protein
MDFWIRFLLCVLLMVAGFVFTYANRTRQREAGQSLYAFLLEAENFNDWGKLARIVLFVSFLAVVGVLIMKMLAILLGGPIIDLDKYK